VLGIVLDMVALGAITSLLARQSMFDEWQDFILFACGLAVISAVLYFSRIPPLVAFSAYFGAVLVGMRFVIGASWAGAAVGASLFLGYKVLVSALL